MGEQTKPKKQICVGLLAHVDAGKTTLSEGLLYTGGQLRRVGRVDHGDAFLDTDTQERERGITIFSKQAVLSLKSMTITLLDTPGHVDFSSEMERTLQVLDYAILVISGTDGVQGHTLTLWRRLLSRYHIPTFLFINKMDLAGADRDALLEQLRQRLSSGCVDFSAPEDAWQEDAAVCDEGILEKYLETGALEDPDVISLIRHRKVFPCWFGSALKLRGVERYAVPPLYPQEFGGKVFKIARDPQGVRLTYLKVTGGSLKVKDLLTNRRPGLPEDQVWEEKADQLRIYSGAQYRVVDQVPAGAVCTVAGLSRTHAGEGLGFETESILPQGTNVHTALKQLGQLEEEDPQLHIAWSEQAREIRLQLMGPVQLEVLTRLIQDRFGLEVSFSTGSILYKETIAAPVVGVGHFEPLRHYAEVPGHRLPRGRAGPELAAAHLHPPDGEGAPGGAHRLPPHRRDHHPPHRPGPREAHRGGRLPPGHLPGGAPGPHAGGERSAGALVRPAPSPAPGPGGPGHVRPPADGGRAPGPGGPGGHDPAHRLRSRVRPPGLRRPGGRLHPRDGAAHPHSVRVPALSQSGGDRGSNRLRRGAGCGKHPRLGVLRPRGRVHRQVGPGEDPHAPGQRPGLRGTGGGPLPRRPAPAPEGLGVLRLSGGGRRAYGHLRAHLRPRPAPGFSAPGQAEAPELKAIARDNLDAARQKLMDLMSNYQGYKKCQVILVFDAYKVPRGTGEISKYHNIYVVYTKEAETADAYIEKTTYELSRKKYRVRVATSDYAEQMIILGHGALRLSATTFHAEVEQATGQINALLQRQNNRLSRSRPVAAAMERARKKS